jgi:hypothetical protein
MYQQGEGKETVVQYKTVCNADAHSMYKCDSYSHILKTPVQMHSANLSSGSPMPPTPSH